MPELPEVEVVKKSLKSSINNSIIRKVTIKTTKLRYKVSKKEISKVINKKILSVERRSKYLLINLENDLTILCHLGMTGKFFIIRKNKIKKTSFYYQLNKNDIKHNHVIFHMSNSTILIYNDVRKFGFLKIIKSKNIYTSSHLKYLGPEPLSNAFNLKYFTDYIKNKKKTIKDALMDQKFIAGLGNIYVNEILFSSRICPKTKTNRISKLDAKNMIRNTQKILKKSITEGGSSIKNFENSEGKQGIFQQRFKVYGRDEKKCLRIKCGGIIRKTVISNRASFYCKRCQK